MEITISVKRQHSASEKAYIQTFHYSGNGKLTVADWLTEVNQAEASNDPIAWECSAWRRSGACAGHQWTADAVLQLFPGECREKGEDKDRTFK